MDVRLVPAPISLVFSRADVDEEAYKREFQKLSESDDDAISQWLKLAKAKGDTSETDPILLNLVVELHRKIDALERLIKNEEPKRISLSDEAEIESIGFGYFKLKTQSLQEGVEYYARIEMPVHPKRDVAIFFKAVDSSVAKITRMHERDEKEWNAYLTARERVLIREAREAKKR
jgi:translation elongation factor EF-1beta